MIIGNLSFAFLGEFLGVCAWGLFFLCGWGGMNGGRDEWREGRMEGGTNGQSASGAGAMEMQEGEVRRGIKIEKEK